MGSMGWCVHDGSSLRGYLDPRAETKGAGGRFHREIFLPKEGEGCRRVAMGWLAGIPERECVCLV